METRKPFEVPSKVLASSEEVTAENMCSIGCFWPGRVVMHGADSIIYTHVLPQHNGE